MKSEKGNVLIIAIVSVLVLSMIAINLTKGTLLSNKSSFSKLNKERSNAMADHGITLLINNTKKYFLDKDTGGFTENKDYIENLKKESAIEIHYTDDENDYTLTTESVLKKRDATNYFESSVYAFNPPTEESFRKLVDMKTNTPLENLGQIAVGGDYNESFEALEFYITAYDETNKKLKVYSYKPFITKIAFELEYEVSITDLYNLKTVGNKHTELELADIVDVAVVYDKSFENINMYLAIGKKDVGEIDLFEYSPYRSTGKMKYLATHNPADYENVKLMSFYSPSLRAAEVYLVTLESGNVISFNAYIPLVGKSTFEQLNKLTIDEVADGKIIDFASNVHWTEEMNATAIYLGLILDKSDVKNVKVFSYFPYARNIFEELVGFRMQEVALDPIFENFNPTHIALTSYYDIEQVGTGYMVMALGNIIDKKITAHIGYPTFGRWTKHSKIDLLPEESIGRLSIGSANSNLSEVVLINPSSIYTKNTYEINPRNNNILAEVFDKSQELASKTLYKLNYIIEYIEPEHTGDREVVKTEVVDIISDEN